MKGNPYRLPEPCLVSFSGGRTSAYMLRKILDAFDGALPGGIVVCFANTGKERPETLRFVHECAVRWNVRVHWLEWRDTDAGFEEVGFNSADREGRTFDALITRKGYVPNAVTRFCTLELKIRTMRDFCRSIGWEHWTSAIGLRYDEGLRVMKALARNDAGKERFHTVMPLAAAHVTKRRDVLPFWLGENADPVNLTRPLPQGFDLGLRDFEGNCDLCFLKSRGRLTELIRANPGAAEWWIDQERRSLASKPSGRRFRKEHTYSELVRAVEAQDDLFDGPADDTDHDVECGLLCEPEDQP